MNTNKKCKLIQDLLPNYIERMTSEETNQFIEKHLNECNECDNVYKNMNKELCIKEKKIDEKKINIFKKINTEMKILKVIILIIIIILLGIFIVKIVNINKIESLSEKINYNNYYERIVETTEKYTKRIEYYQNNDNFIIISTKINKDNIIEKIIEYKYNGKEYRYIEKNGQEIVNEGEIHIEPLEQYQFLNRNFIGNIGLALTPGTLRNITLHNKTCYLLKVENYLNFIDKETGLTIKEINIANNSVIDYTYSFGNVKNEEIEKLINIYQK